MKIGGERAYRLARRGVEVEMPLRRSQVYALDVIAYMGDSVRLELHVGSGTYVRSIAEALGGHCVTLRRTAVGPFAVEEADPNRLMAGLGGARAAAGGGAGPRAGGVRTAVLALEAERVGLRRRPGAADEPAAVRRAPVKVAHAPGELERRPRAVAIGTFDGVHVGHQAVVRAAVEAGRLRRS